MGLRGVETGDGVVTLAMAKSPWLCNAFGVIYGGAIAYLADAERTEMRALRLRHLGLPERGFQYAWPDASTARQRVLVRAERPGPLADSCPARGSALSDRRSGQGSPRWAAHEEGWSKPAAYS